MKGLVLGVDPGSLNTGFGVIRAEADRLTHLAHGRIAVSSRLPLELRLCQIYDGLRELIREHQPQTLALEDIFLANNVKSAFALGQVRGVVLLAAAQASLPVHLYAPLVVKKAVVGYGGASKAQVKLMVEQLLGLKVNNNHAADALAVGVCHLFHSRTLSFYS
ncbi:MAG: crossover junction endodeoxyribonuclease RuvC [Deltaproteobacteria bacterium]|nr:crossover junction endodeoxyribonuclease RuvC [Deltaproteobacteria bacterium]